MEAAFHMGHHEYLSMPKEDSTATKPENANTLNIQPQLISQQAIRKTQACNSTPAWEKVIKNLKSYWDHYSKIFTSAPSASR